MKQKSCTEHEWEPYQQWLGRYVCKNCNVLGYTDGKDYSFLGVRSPVGGKIIPYKCSKIDGRKIVCSKPATSIYGNLAFCNEHKEKMPVSEIRRLEAAEQESVRDQKVMDDAFKRMREATSSVMPRRAS